MYLRPGGFQRITDGWGVDHKCDTFTCRHCQHATEVAVGSDPNEFWCASCMAPICRKCKRQEWNRAPDKPCSHFERRLDEAERRQNLWAFVNGW